MNATRLTIVETHPVQYNAPWFRYLAQNCPAIDLTVLYASRPTPEQQAVDVRRLSVAHRAGEPAHGRVR